MMEIKWQEVIMGLSRIKVEGGHIYNSINGMCFVPEIDLQRYQSHLRDAYNQGLKDGYEKAKAGIPPEG